MIELLKSKILEILTMKKALMSNWEGSARHQLKVFEWLGLINSQHKSLSKDDGKRERTTIETKRKIDDE